MGRHPNVMLQLVLTPLQPNFDVFAHFGWPKPPEGESFGEEEAQYDFDIRVSLNPAAPEYTASVFTDDTDEYNEDWQFNGESGQVILHRYLTYDYGDTINFERLVEEVNVLASWIARENIGAYFSFETRIGANYW